MSTVFLLFFQSFSRSGPVHSTNSGGNTTDMKSLKLLFVFELGALGYGGIEMLWSGGTHWTMLLLGGVCFLCIYLITILTFFVPPVKWMLCALIVTALELLCGIIVNLRLGWNVWDYSAMPGNLLGQICPQYALGWYLLSVPCSALSAAIEKNIFEKVA